MAEEKEFKLKVPFVFFLKIVGVIAIAYIMVQQPKEYHSEWWYELMKGINSFLVPSLILSAIRFVIVSFYNARHAQKAVRGNFVLGINRLTAILNTLFLIIAIMVAFGINPKEFVTSMTIVAMAIAVIFRDYITNLISGLIIMFSEQLSVGDSIKVGENKGRIVDITFANIELQNEEDDIVMIPNNLMFTNPMVNLSAHRSNLFTVKFELPFDTAKDVKTLEDGIRNVVLNHPDLSDDNDFVLQVMEIAKDSVRYKLELYANTSSNKMHRIIENEILREILLFENSKSKSS